MSRTWSKDCRLYITGATKITSHGFDARLPLFTLKQNKEPSLEDSKSKYKFLCGQIFVSYFYLEFQPLFPSIVLGNRDEGIVGPSAQVIMASRTEYTWMEIGTAQVTGMPIYDPHLQTSTTSQQ